MIDDRQIRAAITSVKRGHFAQMELKDPGARGEGRFTLIIRPTKASASAEYYAVWWRDGQRLSTKLGSYPSMSVDEARRLYREDFLPKIAGGRDPHGPRAWRRNVAPTIEMMFAGFVADLEARGRGTANAYAALLGPNGLAEAVGRKRLAAEVRPEDIVPHLKTIRDRGNKSYAFQVRAWANTAFKFAIKSRHRYDSTSSGVDWGVEANPIDAIPSVPEDRRAGERVLTPAEIRDFWFWLEERESPVRWRCCAALRLMIATGQRPSEILKLHASQYDPDDRALFWSTTKNRRPHSIPLPRQAVEILDRLTPNKHGLYFPRQSRPEMPMTSESARWIVDSYVEKTRAEKFTARDLRRTWKTTAGRAGLSKEIRDRLQNHAFSDVSSLHYDRYDYWAEKEAAMARWASALDVILFHQGRITSRMLSSEQPTLLLSARVIEPAPDDADNDAVGDEPEGGEEAA